MKNDKTTMNRFRNHTARIGAVCCIVALAALACIAPLSQGQPVPGSPRSGSDGGLSSNASEAVADATLTLPTGTPETFDPAKWHYGPDSLMGDLFSGLVQLDVNLRPIPDLAESWDISADGTVYTFHLRRGVTFHNGRPFTAQDVKYSWERAANPDTGSDTVLTYMGDIVGMAEVVDGRADAIRGLNIVDDYTIEVTLDTPKVYFLYKLAYPVSWIVDRETIDQIEEDPVGTGPFMLQSYDERQAITLVRNPDYYRGPVALSKIVYLINPGPSTRLYEAGEIDMVYIDEDLLNRANDPSDPLYGNVQESSGFCTHYIVFDTSQPPFEDPLVRRAFALAIDKQQYDQIANEGKGVIADGLYPPGLPGHTDNLTPLTYDPNAAREALSASSYGSADALPEIVLTTGGAGLDIGPGVALVVDMWQETLGVTTTIEQIDFQSYYDEVYAGHHGQILFDGWCADYPDPESFAGVLLDSHSRQNIGHYTNPDVDSLLARARVEEDVQTRMDLYQQIEQTAIDDAAMVFMTHTRTYYLVTKPYVRGYVSTPIGVAQTMNMYFEE